MRMACPGNSRSLPRTTTLSPGARPELTMNRMPTASPRRTGRMTALEPWTRNTRVFPLRDRIASLWTVTTVPSLPAGN